MAYQIAKNILKLVLSLRYYTYFSTWFQLNHNFLKIKLPQVLQKSIATGFDKKNFSIQIWPHIDIITDIMQHHTIQKNL